MLEKLLSIGIVAIITSLVNGAPGLLPTNVVDLGYAIYQGVPLSNTTNTQFLGIRFAAPPTGAFRFNAPQSPTPTPGIQVANSFGPQCFQTGDGIDPTNPFRMGNNGSLSSVRVTPVERRATTTSEDCLFLNVYVPGPQINSTANLPVIFWIHGGGYQGGTGTDPGNDLLPLSGNGVVVVTVSYRLGVFGFLPGQTVKDGGALNAGLLDQQFALQWTQQHIGKFGGDPAKVTIWGESAGAGSVLQQVIANGGRTTPPLFRAAMTSSTFLPSQYTFNDPQAEALYSAVVSGTGCLNVTDTLSCLRGLDANTLQSTNAAISQNAFFGTFVFAPVVDGTFIREEPLVAMQNKRVNGQSLLAVTNTFEGAAFVDSRTANTVQVANYVQQLFPKTGLKEANAAAAAYASVGTPINQVIGIMGESIFICPTYFLLQAFQGRSWKANTGEFAIPPGSHGQDVAYYFTSQNAGGVPGFNNTVFDIAFPDSFVDFAMFLDPNHKHRPVEDKKPFWATWSVGQTEMLFNKTDSNDPVLKSIQTDAGLLERCRFWQTVGALTGQ